MATITSFTTGDIVVSISGDGDGSGNYTDNQASPVTLEELTPAGTVVGTFVLPQTTTTVNGVTQNAISSEYGSSSEGTLELSADGHSLVFAGYGVNAATYNTSEAGVTGSKGAGGIYGNNALAQTYSVATGGTNGAPTGDIVVPRVIADIGANGTVDTSTSLINVDNENNPRSVATTNGSTFYLSGQGVKGDTTQGVFVATNGAATGGANTTPTAISTATDTRTAELYNGTLYVSADSSAAKGTGNISSYGTSPTGKTTATPLPGITGTVALGAGNGNGVNSSTGTVDLSPENFFFANSTTLYIADSGNPKGGTTGDGGLQKWTLGQNGTWSLNYTLSQGLNLVANSSASGTTGLIGLTGQVVGNNVTLYATNSTIGDLDQTSLFGITDSLSATAASTSTTESFSTLVTAAADTNIRGVAFAPSVVCFTTGTLIRVTRDQRVEDVAVEDLAVGDVALTASGASRPIRWIGHRTISSPAFEQLPVRVLAGAFGGGLPERDLYLSPGHPVLVGGDVDHSGGVLVPIMCLINGTTIERVPVDEVTYWHVELDEHDILLAEGLPAESFLDYGNRPWFSEEASAADHALHDPDFIAPGLGARCRPVAFDGPLVETERRRLDALFAMRLAAQCGWPSPHGMFAGLN